MTQYSTRPQGRGTVFLTEKGKRNLDSLLSRFLTERGKRNFYSVSLTSLIGTTIFAGFIVFAVNSFSSIKEDQLFSMPSIDFSAIGGAEDDQPAEVKQRGIPRDIYPGKWVQPLPGNVFITQGQHGRLGDAVDIRAQVGTQVFSTRSGRIFLSEGGCTEGDQLCNGGHGNYIKIKHADGSRATYSHLSVLYVEYGQIVQQGQVIGLSGNTGRSSGPHLHFAVSGEGVENPMFR